ncbi:glycoside hydrolase family 99-like domain-containing protein [Methylocapsa sp. S129]|uniref:glycoside hydrolase family 99-like domain-containing protein n=1 Tax=Methylocapsa sp. S129 TaxID=1641869 RepID=UPI00131DBE52|nr:glycoside hydrolase family 99-like domain-containing protein [Methylocapsa sp. S129]
MSEFLNNLARSSRAARTRARHQATAKAPVVAAATEEPDRDASSKTPPSEQSSESDLSEVFALLRSSALFDEDYYGLSNPDVIEAGRDPLKHFFHYGYLEGRRPNPVFDPIWYLETNAEVKIAGQHPLLHYISLGEREGRRPCRYFDPAWYRATYALAPDEGALAHYLKHRFGPFSPIPEFDAKYYLETYKDIAAAGGDPFDHFISWGHREGRNPSANFDTKFYRQRYLRRNPERNPLDHYLEHRGEPDIFPVPPENDATISAQVKRFTKPGPHFEEFRPLPMGSHRRAKILAYYLTQFHSFPENDAWWGKGFTEWTNIARGQPRFKDHYQPRIPRDLGFYSLADIDTMRKQAEMAKAAGVYGFVFYYYTFNGKRLLERPLEQFLQAPDIDMPFCLMWANENWTRRWDGMESEVLISQDYREDDDARLVKEYARHFSDRRYIRIQGRPLMMIYRPSLIPSTARTIARWRSLFVDQFGENPIIIMSQSFDDYDPSAFGLDGAIEFPPHKLTKNIPLADFDPQILDDTFSGQIFAYDDLVKRSLEEARPSFPLIKTIVPSWDNDARRQGAGLVVHGSTPAKYEAWLSALVERAQRNSFFGEPIVCVNAWNEWCEGAYLEPDLHFGAAYLNATGRGVVGATQDAGRPRLLLVGHDAFPSGAQQLLLNIGKTLQSAFGVEIEFLLLAGGAMESDYSAVAPLTVAKDRNALAARIRELSARRFSAAIVNTSASGDAALLLAAQGVGSILLIHELPRLLREKALEGSARAGIASAKHVVFASAFVCEKVIEALGLPASEKLMIRPQGSYKQVIYAPAEAEALRKELGLDARARLVLGVGYADMRKGFDLFLQVWRLLRSTRPTTHFCWVGGIDPNLKEWLAGEMAEAIAAGTLHMVGYRSDVAAFFSAADALLLTSREDPFPTVALEAMSVGAPVIAFDRSGGIADFLKEEALGLVVPYCDAPAMAAELRKLIADGPDRAMQARAQEAIEKRFGFPPYVRDLLRLVLPDLASVSVTVPNYNYAHCLADRLNTIFDQTHPVEEVIVLDDASRDNSVEVIEGVAEERERDITLVINDVNSGSVFAQWAKAAEMAQGDYIWVAEADDLSEPSFLATMLAAMRTDPAIEIAFCDSRSIDAVGAPVYASYKPYFETIEPGALSRSEVFEGADFLRRFLSVKNTILNVSSVVWRRDALLRCLSACRDELSQYKMAGDWRLYIECLTVPGAKIAYVADPLNVHRRHAQSVTHSLKAQKHVDEIRRMHRAVAERLADPRGVTTLQDAYIEEVTKQLFGGKAASEPARKRKVRAKRKA